MAYIKDINNLIDLINYLYNRKTHQRLSIFLLQDLLYISQGICLAVYHQPLFDDDIVAQTHGPHVASVDWKLRGVEYLKPMQSPNDYINSVLNAFHDHDDTNPKYNVGRVVHCVFSCKGYYMSNGRVLGLSLSKKGTPYDTVMKHIESTRENNPFEDDYPDLYTGIPKDLIKKYFSKKIVVNN